MSKRITKTSVVKPPKVKNSIFKSTANKFVEQTDAVNIAKALKEAEKVASEEKLLALELEKPVAARNKALMRKYGYLDSASSIDKYPDISGTEKYKITMTAPEDNSIPVALRPKPKYHVVVDFKYHGNEFIYRFPVARAVEHDGETVYKLDGFTTFLDSNLDVIDEISDYDLYQALLDFKHENISKEVAISDVLQKYGISKSDDDVNKDFRLKGQNFSVTSSKRRTADVKEAVDKTEEPVKTKKDSKNRPKGLAKGYNLHGLTVEPNAKTSAIDPLTSVKVIENVITRSRNNGFKLLGLADDDFIDSATPVIIDHVYNNKTLSSDTWVMLSDYVDGNMYVSVINGPSSVKKAFNYNGRADTLNDIVASQNKKIFKAYKDAKK